MGWAFGPETTALTCAWAMCSPLIFAYGCGGWFFVADDGGVWFQVAGCDLEAVAEEAGASVVDGFGGEALGNFGERLLDGSAVEVGGELELVVGDDGGGWVHAVLVAEVLVVHGVGAAATVLVGPEAALVRDVWVAFGAVVVIHGCVPSPRGGIDL
jgi:hypothetical protein